MLYGELRAQLLRCGDPTDVDRIVRVRCPRKPVIGLRMPTIGHVLTNFLSRCELRDDHARGIADALWDGVFHEEELAACRLLRTTKTTITPHQMFRWAGYADNWLSADELAVCVGEACAGGLIKMSSLERLRRSRSDWARRVFVVAMIVAARSGTDRTQCDPLIRSMTADPRRRVTDAVARYMRASDDSAVASCGDDGA